MNPLTLEWIEKAEADFLTARREYRARVRPNYDAACFHAQQTAEKYLKAFLQDNDLAVPRTHSLLELNGLISRIDPTFLLMQPDLNIMEGYAVQFRYPGFSAEKSDARKAIDAAARLRLFIREKFPFD